MTTFGETSYECPICDEPVPAKVLHSTNQMGQDTDFCPVTMGCHAVPIVIHACINCGYAGYDNDFEEKKLSAEEKMRFLDANISEGLIPLEARLERISPDHAYYLAFMTRRHFGAPPEALGDLLLKASWCLRLEGGRPRDDVAASRYRREAIREYGRALEKAGNDPDGRRTYLYNIAELNRREGNFDEAVANFSRFLENPPDELDWVKAAIGLEQRARATDRSNFTFEDVIKVVGHRPPERG